MVYDGLLFLFPDILIGKEGGPLLGVASSFMRYQNSRTVLSLFNRNHEFEFETRYDEEPKPGAWGKLYQTGTLFTSLLDKEWKPDHYKSRPFTPVVFVGLEDPNSEGMKDAGGKAKKGGKGKKGAGGGGQKDADDQKEANKPRLRFSMTPSHCYQLSDSIK